MPGFGRFSATSAKVGPAVAEMAAFSRCHPSPAQGCVRLGHEKSTCSRQRLGDGVVCQSMACARLWRAQRQRCVCVSWPGLQGDAGTPAGTRAGPAGTPPSHKLGHQRGTAGTPGDQAGAPAGAAPTGRRRRRRTRVRRKASPTDHAQSSQARRARHEHGTLWSGASAQPSSDPTDPDVSVHWFERPALWQSIGLPPLMGSTKPKGLPLPYGCRLP